MDIQSILERFLLISGLTEEEATSYMQLLNEAKSYIESKIKDNVNTTTESRRLNAAAAALGFYKYVLAKASRSGAESFSVGDVSVKCTSNASIDIAKQVWYEAKASVCDILKDDNFFFESISFC